MTCRAKLGRDVVLTFIIRFSIMQCSNFQVAGRCPTMMSGWWRGKEGLANGCQCFDDNPAS